MYLSPFPGRSVIIVFPVDVKPRLIVEREINYAKAVEFDLILLNRKQNW